MARAAPPQNQRKRSVLRLIPRHGAFPIAAISGLVVGLATLAFRPDLAIGLGANAWFAVYLGIVFLELPRLTPDMLKSYADDEDPPIVLIMLVTLLVVAVSTLSLFLSLNHGGPLQVPQVVLGGVSVVLGWFVVHTMAALHYAFEYYETPDEPNAKRQRRNVGGFAWPEDGDRPNGIAFLYISYQIGAALQISDVPVTSNKMRALVIGQTVFAFFYNTILVAAGVSIVVLAASAK